MFHIRLSRVLCDCLIKKLDVLSLSTISRHTSSQVFLLVLTISRHISSQIFILVLKFSQNCQTNWTINKVKFTSVGEEKEYLSINTNCILIPLKLGNLVVLLSTACLFHSLVNRAELNSCIVKCG